MPLSLSLGGDYTSGDFAVFIAYLWSTNRLNLLYGLAVHTITTLHLLFTFVLHRLDIFTLASHDFHLSIRFTI